MGNAGKVGLQSGFVLLGATVWSIDLYKVATGLIHMSVPEAVCDGAILLFAPWLIWQSVDDLRRVCTRMRR